VLRALEAIKILGSESPEHVYLIGSTIINITDVFNNPEYLDKITGKDVEENDETDILNADGALCVVDDNT
jgi:L-fucose isomerase-like protein